MYSDHNKDPAGTASTTTITEGKNINNTGKVHNRSTLRSEHLPCHKINSSDHSKRPTSKTGNNPKPGKGQKELLLRPSKFLLKIYLPRPSGIQPLLHIAALVATRVDNNGMPSKKK